MGHRSFCIWFSYSLTAVLLLLPESDLAGDKEELLDTMAALAKWSRVSLAGECCSLGDLGDSRGARIAAISDLFFWISPLREKGRLKSGKAAG